MAAAFAATLKSKLEGTAASVAAQAVAIAHEIKGTTAVAADPCNRVTAPERDPGDVYPQVPDLDADYSTFRLTPQGLDEVAYRRALDVTRVYHDKKAKRFLGYQANGALDYATHLSHYLDILVNNIGDPFQLGTYSINSKFMEQAVLDYFASLWNARWPHDNGDAESYWGFALSMGSTEGNLYGMWNARDYLSGKYLLIEQERTKSGAPGKLCPTYHQAPLPEGHRNSFTPVAFYSEDTHYSLSKVMTIMSIKTFYELGNQEYPGECPLPGTGEWPRQVPSNSNGEGSIDVDALAVLAEFFVSRGYPIIVNFNYGSTFKGAYDHVEEAGKRLLTILEKYDMLERKICYDTTNPDRCVTRNGYWFHVDGALGAAYMPFVERAHCQGKIPERGPNFDFRLPYVSSISMSGHKWIGAPMPCGVYLTRTKFQLQPPDIPNYTGTPDTTFAGSRNGLSAILLWDYLARSSFDDLQNKALETLAMAEYVEKSLKDLEKRLNTDLQVRRSPLALTVLFKRPRDEIVRKYTLSNDTDQGLDYSHMYAMEHVTRHLVDELVHDLGREGAFDDDFEPFELDVDGVPVQRRSGGPALPELIKW